MLGEDYFVGKAIEGLAKGTSGTLLKHGLKSANGRDSPISKPEDCFWGADSQLYCPVNKLPGQQSQVTDTEVRGRDPLPHQSERPRADFTEPAAKPWEQEFQTDPIDLEGFSDENTTFDDQTLFQSS